MINAVTCLSQGIKVMSVLCDCNVLTTVLDFRRRAEGSLGCDGLVALLGYPKFEGGIVEWCVT